MKNNRSLSWVCIVIITLFISSCCKGRKENTDELTREAALSVIENRKSVRNFISGKAVQEEDIEVLLKAGMSAPSGKDTRPWEFVVIQDRSVLDTLASGLRNAQMLSESPLAIVICGDSIRSFYWYLDCSAAAQNILLAAEALDLGAVWTAAYPYEDRMKTVSSTLKLPEHILPLVVIPIGYPDGEFIPKDKYDKSKIHYDSW